jgi:hypothetical protein
MSYLGFGRGQLGLGDKGGERLIDFAGRQPGLSRRDPELIGKPLARWL